MFTSDLQQNLAKMRAVTELAREWAADHQSWELAYMSESARSLYLAVAEAFPQDFGGKEACCCGEICDECPTEKQVQEALAKLRTQNRACDRMLEDFGNRAFNRD